MHEHQSAEYQFVGFDELTTFGEEQYLYLFSRVRSSRGVPCRMRAGTNPGGVGHAWVFARWSPWLDPQSATPARPGQTLYFLRLGGAAERAVRADTPLAKGRTFIPARLEDNPSLAADGKYEGNLQLLDPVTRERLRYGNWLVQGERYLFNGVRHYDALPAGCRFAVGFDLAATAKTTSDWCVAVVLAECGGKFYVVDVRREHADVPTFARTLKELSATYQSARFFSYVIAGEKMACDLLRDECGIRGLVGEITSEKKYARALPCASAWNDLPAMGALPAREGRVYVPEYAPWLQTFLAEVTTFDGLERAHDDQVDALAAAFDTLDRSGSATVPKATPTKFEAGRGGVGKFQW